ncbi:MULTISPECIES: hypothetical protein [Thermomonospora]|uniref:Uncharacterized protein n=1 Tax=Thermomonospora curvata (strain ATCC 19995 / DSM 43183 / JCM 3096 / KCTC 9072 / NBRC 15933 / NCIMB 10081 / Henssen B9) TaxID=471852 RepID=D1A7W7_THECD|nr:MULTISPECIES: hypothetical protein [Thermomonospora]ACY98489.1 hypothetical protein Tcur_2947 [Thermomonospora curvata DSM 43183]PKK13635.1 MAG: hypothetical protein BUE48_014360 [Thermomonospora sp. CIF 1]
MADTRQRDGLQRLREPCAQGAARLGGVGGPRREGTAVHRRGRITGGAGGPAAHGTATRMIFSPAASQ